MNFVLNILAVRTHLKLQFVRAADGKIHFQAVTKNKL